MSDATPEQAADTIREALEPARWDLKTDHAAALAALKVLEDAATNERHLKNLLDWRTSERVSATQRANREQARADTLTQALREVEKNCPCGARPESPNTHPHVIGCPVGLALGSPSVADNYAKAIYGSSLAEEDDDD